MKIIIGISIIFLICLQPGCSSTPSKIINENQENIVTPSSAQEAENNTNDFSQTQDIEFCDLVKNPEKYRDKLIRTTGIIYFAPESAFLYDPQCIARKKFVWIQIPDFDSNELLEPYVTFETQEYKTLGVNRVKANLSGKFQSNKDDGFGHLGSFQSQLTVNKINEIIPFSKDTPYPW